MGLHYIGPAASVKHHEALDDGRKVTTLLVNVFSRSA